MKKAELIDKVAKDAEISKKAAASVLDALVGVIRDSLSNEKGQIRIADLGTFKVVQRKARNGRNPRTGQRMNIPAGNIARFVPSRALKISAGGQDTEQLDPCEDIQGTVRRVLCKACRTPVVGPALPFCREHGLAAH
ncbi:MAG: HU family DNA-binding protein [Desulfomonilaceae bacterium]